MKKKIILSAKTMIAGFAIILSIFGCESSPTSNGGSTDADYRFDGTLIKDLNLNNTKIAANLEKYDSSLTSAVVTFSTDTLSYNDVNAIVDSIYTLDFDFSNKYPSGNYNLTIEDNDLFSQTISVAVGDTFSINSIVPTTGQWRPTDGAVVVSWNGSENVDGFIVAVVKADEAYQGSGYSAYSTSMVTSESILPDVFYTSNVLDTGLYKIFVYGYSGVVDRSLANLLLPTSLPDQLADNITSADLTGHFGSIVVSASETLRVVTQ